MILSIRVLSDIGWILDAEAKSFFSLFVKKLVVLAVAINVLLKSGKESSVLVLLLNKLLKSSSSSSYEKSFSLIVSWASFSARYKSLLFSSQIATLERVC